MTDKRNQKVIDAMTRELRKMLQQPVHSPVLIRLSVSVILLKAMQEKQRAVSNNTASG